MNPEKCYSSFPPLSPLRIFQQFNGNQNNPIPFPTPPPLIPFGLIPPVRGTMISTVYHNTSYQQPTLPSMNIPAPTNNKQPSPSNPRVQAMAASLSERERKIREKKKNLERKRRAGINASIKRMYDRAFQMCGETNRKKEIRKMTEDCERVMESVYKNVMEDPTLKARLLPPGLLSSEFTGINSPTQSTVSSPLRDEDRENVPPTWKECTPFLTHANPAFNQTTSSKMEHSGLKSVNGDSGLGLSQPSTSNNITNSSSLLSRESAPSTQSKNTSESPIWRPYLP